MLYIFLIAVSLALDAFAVARSVGELRAVNVAMVGAMSTFLDAQPEFFEQGIDRAVKERFREVNKQAFWAGRKAVA